MKKVKYISIDSLAFGGNGVGRIDGKVCFVPYSCPGDQLHVEIISDKKSYQSGLIREIVKPSPDRVKPHCVLFGKCGGCAWQHVSYDLQLAAKHKILSDALWRGARVGSEAVQSIIPSAERYGYRSRVQFKLHTSNDGLKIGFFRPNSHHVEDVVDGCPLAASSINQALASLRVVFRDFADIASIEEIHIDCAENGAVALLEYSGNKQGALSGFILEHQEQLKPLTSVYIHATKSGKYVRIYGDEYLYYSLPFAGGDGTDCSLSYLPGSFSQVNRLQNKQLLNKVAEFLKPEAGLRLLDLYCGNGNFSLPLCRLLSSVTGVETSESSIDAAISNSKRNFIKNARYVCADSVDYINKLVREGEKFDVVLLDPPRAGAADVVPGLCCLSPVRIVYVSCDPNTLARDCALFALHGYDVKKSVPLDMFPQTWHLESVTLLEKNGF